MATIAELQIKLDSNPVRTGTQDLNNFADAAQRASSATNNLNKNTGGQGGRGGIVPAGESRKVKDLSEAIDEQTRKLGDLARQRTQLEGSSLKSTQPAEYERLNRIIDANIALVRRQGNAVETLSERRNRDAVRHERQVAAELALEERLARGVERRESAVSAAAAREARIVEQTINGLSRQIKAQNEYNATIETLNRARATSGLGGPSTNSISGSEYESYVKLAQAQRDAQLATADNSRELERTSRQLDGYVATLSKAERANVEFARATGVLNEAQRLGLVTTEQYDTRLAQFTAKRDAAVNAANSNAQAEQRFERQLRSVLNAYNPLQAAQENYNASVAVLSSGLQTGAISAEQFNRALTDQVNALDRAKAAQEKNGDPSAEYERALRSLLPYRAQLENLQRQQVLLNNAKRDGLVVTQQEKAAHEAATVALQRETREVERRIAQGNKLGNSYKQDQAALRGLPAQITDIVVSLQGGQAPLTVLLQQGGQIKDQFGGIVPALTGVARGVLSLITPVSVLATVLGLTAIAAYQGSNELVAFNRAVTQSRNFSGATASQFTSFANTLEDVAGSTGKAAEALTAIEASGKIAAEQFVNIAEAAILFEKSTGQALDKTIEDFTSLGKEPVEAAVRLDEKYKFLTASVLAQASALTEQGKTQEAVVLLQETLASSITETAATMIEQAGYIERAWYGVRDGIKSAIDAVREIGRAETTQSRIDALAEANANIYRIRGFRSEEQAERADKRYASNAAEIRQLQQKAYFEEQAAGSRRQQEQDRQKDVSYLAQLDAGYRSNLTEIDKVRAAQEELAKVNKRADEFRERAARNGRELSAREVQLIETERLAAENKLKAAREAGGKGGNTPVDSTNLTDVKSNTQALVAEYDRYYKQVTELGKANVVSSEATYRSQLAILQAQASAVSKAYDDQITEIEKLQSRKGNTASQSISLENQLTKAEAARTKAAEDNQAKQEQLTLRFTADTEKRRQATVSYNEALREQVNNLAEQGRRAAEDVGRGDRQRGVSGQLNDNDRDFQRNQRRLAEQLAGGSINAEQQKQMMADLTQAHTDATDQIIANDMAIQRANADWTNGFTRAIENAKDDALDLASAVERGLTGSFRSAGDALATFVTTGKFSFKDFASSVIADLARIAAQQAATGILSSVLGFAATAASAYFTGGASTAGSAATAGTGGAGFGQLGGQYTSTVFAKGGAFTGGTQYFANGGTFTNDIVNSATSFDMSGGRRGVMGEAGPEAIVPLARTSNGDLGVRVAGGGAERTGGGNTVVNVVVNVADGQSQSESDDGQYNEFGDRLGTFITQEVYKVINKETRPGGSLKGSNDR